MVEAAIAVGQAKVIGSSNNVSDDLCLAAAMQARACVIGACGFVSTPDRVSVGVVVGRKGRGALPRATRVAPRGGRSHRSRGARWRNRAPAAIQSRGCPLQPPRCQSVVRHAMRDDD